MTYDWIAKNLYFSNSGRITVVQVDNPKIRRDIIREQAFALVCDPNAGFLFYTVITRPAKIVRVFLDGTNRTEIVRQGLSLPYTLSIDYSASKLYWADAHLSKIQYADFNGNNVVTLLSSALVMPISLTVYKYYAFYVDFRLASVYKTSKFFGMSPMILRQNLNNVYQIKAFGPDLQTSAINHPCARQNGDCSHFCFAVPSSDPQYKISRHCGCPYGMKLDAMVS